MTHVIYGSRTIGNGFSVNKRVGEEIKSNLHEDENQEKVIPKGHEPMENNTEQKLTCRLTISH